MAPTLRERGNRPNYGSFAVDKLLLNKKAQIKSVKTVGVFEVERVVARRKTSEGIRYLLKWKDYSAFCNTWEPEHHLTTALLNSYSNPNPPRELVQQCLDRLRRGVMESLRGKAIIQQFTIEFRCDVYRFLFSEDRPNVGTWKVCENLNFLNEYLPDGWDAIYNQHGDGFRIKYPIKLRWFLSRAPKNFVSEGNKVIEVSSSYEEKLTFSFIKDPCSFNAV